MTPRPEQVWAGVMLVGVACLGAAGFLVSMRVGLLVLGLSLLYCVKLGTGRRD